MKPTRTLLISAAGACLAFAGVAQGAPARAKPAGDVAIRKALRERLRAVDFKDIPFKDVLQFLRDVTDCSIQMEWEAVEQAKVKLTPQTRVTLKAKNVTVAAVIRQVLDNAAGAGAMDFVVEQGRVLILPKAVADSRFISRLDADLRAVNAGAAKATGLVKQLLKARAGLPATSRRVAALERQLRRTAGPVLRQIDRKLSELGKAQAKLAKEGFKEMDPRRKAVAERLTALAGALDTIAAAGAWEPVPPAPAGKRRLLFRPDRTSRLKARPKPASAPVKPRGKWTAEKGKVVLIGESVELTFDPDAPAAGDVELRTTLSFKGDKVRTVQIILGSASLRTKQGGTYSCLVLRRAKPAWCELTCISTSSAGPKTPTASVHLPALKEGKAYPLRLLVRGRKLTCSFANRTASIDCDPLPAGANLRYVQLIAGSAGGSVVVVLDDFKITCAAEAAKPATKATAEQERQAANLLKVGDANRKIGLKKKAIGFYERIVKEYPATAAAKEAKYWLKILR